ncbi:hypothetical protein SAMN05444141_109206 [Pseudovibrio denitrificans]|uniref:Uncharacterized protein n=2 Tax=Pseudovibrio denitrificans TaxID=258256 RepID=A0A1I7DN83_9HYPH|nr:hypothetical protein [Pseudovibrio denitrificans]SFU13076.1 hypothetical protein SAMN05444141_109206 [Pseudovibrio denitrificans]
MFSRKTRKGLLGGVVLALAGLMAGEAGAAGGMLITKAYCDKFTNPRDILWAHSQRDHNNRRNYTNLFYMKPNGNIIKVFGENAFDEVDKLFITSHGTCAGVGDVGGMENAAFAQSIRNAQGGHARLNEILTVSCQAASRTAGGLGPSFLKSLADNVRTNAATTISGWPDNVVMVGGNGLLVNSIYTDQFDVAQPQDLANLIFAASSISKRWDNEIVRMELLPQRIYTNSFRAQCENMLETFEVDGPSALTANQRERMFEEFNSVVRTKFLPADPYRNPIRSFAYLAGLTRSTADNKVTCGPGVGVNCP